MCFFPTFAASFGFRLTLFAMNAYYYPDFQSFQKSLWFIDRALLVLGSYIHRPSGKRWDVSSNSSYYMTMSMSYVHQKTKRPGWAKKSQSGMTRVIYDKEYGTGRIILKFANSTHRSNWECVFVSISHSWRSLSKKILKDDNFKIIYILFCTLLYVTLGIIGYIDLL